VACIQYASDEKRQNRDVARCRPLSCTNSCYRVVTDAAASFLLPYAGVPLFSPALCVAFRLIPAPVTSLRNISATVPSENSVQPTSHVISRDESQNRSSLQPSLSLANEIRRGTGVQTSTARTLISEPHREAARSLVDARFSGSPSFVAVVQSTDLRHCHD
jgi:hypothetical protein